MGKKWADIVVNFTIDAVFVHLECNHTSAGQLLLLDPW